MRAIILITLSTMLWGCSLVGDGRGFASVQGTIQAELEDDSFTSNTDTVIGITDFDLDVSYVQMEANISVDSGVETLKTIMPVSASISAAEKNSTVAFGPFEVGRAQYSRLGVMIRKVKVSWTQDGGEEFGLVLSDLELMVEAAADLPVERDELPQIGLVTRLTVPETVLDNVTSDMTEEAAKTQILANLESGLELSATWTRSAD